MEALSILIIMQQYQNKIDGIMIGREAYKNPWIFNSDLNYENIEGKKQIIYDY